MEAVGGGAAVADEEAVVADEEVVVAVEEDPVAVVDGGEEVAEAVVDRASGRTRDRKACWSGRLPGG